MHAAIERFDVPAAPRRYVRFVGLGSTAGAVTRIAEAKVYAPGP